MPREQLPIASIVDIRFNAMDTMLCESSSVSSFSVPLTASPDGPRSSATSACSRRRIWPYDQHRGVTISPTCVTVIRNTHNNYCHTIPELLLPE